MKIRAVNSALRARDAEKFAQRLQYRSFAGRIRADNRGEVACDFNRLRLGPETAEARDGDGLDAHV